MKARDLLAMLMREPLGYEIVPHRGSNRRLEAPGPPSLTFAFHDRVTKVGRPSMNRPRAARGRRDMRGMTAIGLARGRLGLTLACAGLLAVGCGGDRDAASRSGARADSAQLSVSTNGWTTDFSRHSVPLSEFASGGPGRDGIPPIDDPKFVSQAAADEWLADREPVLVVELGGLARAYPVQILTWHEIVNDDFVGHPIAVTFCPLCNSSLVFDRRVDGRELTFGTTGNLRNSDLVMWDRQTESWWQQFTGEAIVGGLTGERLEALTSQTVSWKDFREKFPGGDVLSRDTGFDRDYGRNPYERYDRPDDQPFLFDREADDRLPAKERVAAVFVGDAVVVVPFSRLRASPVVDLEVAGTPVVVVFKSGVASALDKSRIADSADAGTSAAFNRRLKGRTLDFKRRGDGIADQQTGSTWDITGRAIAGPLEGKRLRAVRHDQQFWFALAAFLPDARIVSTPR